MKLSTLFTTFSLILIPLVIGATPAPLRAFHLTGTWHGRWSCTQFDGTKTKDGNKMSTMLISQIGNTLAVDLDSGSFFYNGRALADAKKPDTQGEIVLAECGTDNLPGVGAESELIRAKVKMKADSVKGTLKGLSIFENDVPEVGTCKYSFKRDDTTNSGVTPCP